MYPDYYQGINNPNMKPYNNFKPNMNQYNSNDDRLIGGGFLGPFILGGITGGLLAPSFYPRPYYNPRPYYPYPNYYYYGGYYR